MSNVGLGSQPLAEIIRQEIAQAGPIPFRRFMELALYHPEHGYYAGGANRVGRQGDFITNVSVGAFFGTLLAQDFARRWRELGRPAVFDLLELGANQGQLVADVRRALETNDPEAAAAARFHIVEPFPLLQRAQEQTLAESLRAGRVRWHSHLQEIEDGALEGVIWSNELFDALPVHRVRRLPSGWAELYVASGESGELIWTTGEPTFDCLDLPAGFPAHTERPVGYTTELWPHADFWTSELARVLRAGFVVTIDYGFEAQEYYAGHRTDGTLQAYREQRRSSSILEDAGHRDITAHVNFTALIEAGKKFGLELESFTTQERFLMGALQSTPPAELERLDDASKRQLRTLTHPEMLGSVFKVLVQRKSKESKST